MKVSNSNNFSASYAVLTLLTPLHHLPKLQVLMMNLLSLWVPQSTLLMSWVFPAATLNKTVSPREDYLDQPPSPHIHGQSPWTQASTTSPTHLSHQNTKYLTDLNWKEKLLRILKMVTSISGQITVRMMIQDTRRTHWVQICSSNLDRSTLSIRSQHLELLWLQNAWVQLTRLLLEHQVMNHLLVFWMFQRQDCGALHSVETWI